MVKRISLWWQGGVQQETLAFPVKSFCTIDFETSVHITLLKKIKFLKNISNSNIAAVRPFPQPFAYARRTGILLSGFSL